MIRCLVLCLGLFLGARALAQTSLSGKIADTLEKKALENAVVSLLNKKDSVLVAFTRSKKTGEFEIAGIKPGSYLLLVTYPRFADFVEEVMVDSVAKNMGTVPLTLQARLLDAVIVRSAAAIRMRGDTTEFTADSFKVREGATVEELLRRLPGFTVNSKGEITAQGQKVDKVLVDGEEFFGNDPTMATQNIGAKAVDKIQVYDNKDAQQNLTSTSVASEGKTINIKLKEEARKGSFGRAHAATDFESLTDAKLLYNRFVQKKKISAYATKSLISTGSLDWEDREKLGIEDTYEYDEISGYYTSFGDDDDFDNWSVRGLPDSYTAGALFSNKWNSDRLNLNGSYRYNNLKTRNDAYTLTQNILESGITYRNRYQNSRGTNTQHAGSFKYEWKLDSLSSVKYTFVGSKKVKGVFSITNSEFLNEARQFINQSEQDLANNSTKTQLDNAVQYNRLFKKKNRQLIVSLRHGYINDDQDGTVKTVSRFYKNNTIDSVDIADQLKLFDGNSATYGTRVTYNEPFGAKWNLAVEYSLNKNASHSFRNTYNRDASGKYTVLDKGFSNNFELDAWSNGGMAVMKYADKKLKVAFGSGMSNITLKLNNLDSAKRNTYNFLNLTPQAGISYNIKPQTRLNFGYRGRTQQPSIEQLQPVRNNTDRLDIFVGNPDLKVAFNNDFSLGYNDFKTLAQRYMSAQLRFSKPLNAISMYRSVDLTTGQQVTRPVNVNGNYNWTVWSYFAKEMGDNKVSYGLNVNMNGGRNITLVNEIANSISTIRRNSTSSYNLQLGPNVRYGSENKNISLQPNVGYNYSKSTLRKDFTTKYWNYGGSLWGYSKLFWKMEARTNAEFIFRQKINGFQSNPNQVIWNAELSKSVLKKGNGKIVIVANDLLNQNRGFERSIETNFIREEKYSRISQYFLLRFEWTFNKMNTPANE